MSTRVREGAGYRAALQASRTFHSPDCVEAMAEAYGLLDGLDALRVSHFSSPFLIRQLTRLFGFVHLYKVTLFWAGF